MTRRWRWMVVALVGAMLAPVPIGRVEAGPPACEKRTNNTVDKLLECVTLSGVREHQLAFQRIADANGGNRFSGFPGYDRSVDYVVSRLEAAGYEPVVQPFDYTAFVVVGPSALQQTAPGDRDLRRRRRLRCDRPVRPR